jgi:hypothetical protein
MLSDDSCGLLNCNYFADVGEGLYDIFWSDVAVVVEVKYLKSSLDVATGHELSNVNSSSEELIVLYGPAFVEIYHVYDFFERIVSYFYS